MNNINNMTTAQTNSTDLVENHQTLVDDCVIVVGDEPTGPSFKSRHEGQILFNNTPVTNTNVSSGEITWLGKEFDYNGKKTSVNIQQAIATRLKRLRRQYGITINGMCVVPKASLDAFYHGVKTAKDEFLDKRDHLLAQLPALLEEHKKANPDIANLIDDKSLDVNQLRGKYSFKESIPLAVTLHRPEDKDNFEISAVDALFEELASEWNDNYKKSFANKDRVSQRALKYFTASMDKLLRLAWLNEGIYRVIDTMQEVLAKMPKTGWIEKGDFNELARYALLLSNKDGLMAHANGGTDDVAEEDELISTDALSDVVDDSDDVTLLDDINALEIEDDTGEEIQSAQQSTEDESEVDLTETIEQEIAVDESDVEEVQEDALEVVDDLVSGNLQIIEDGSDDDDDLFF